MSRVTSRGKASVRLVCEAFGLSRQAYYAAWRRPARPAPKPRPERQGNWATASELEAAIRRVTAEQPGWGVRKVWAFSCGARASSRRASVSGRS